MCTCPVQHRRWRCALVAADRRERGRTDVRVRSDVATRSGRHSRANRRRGRAAGRHDRAAWSPGRRGQARWSGSRAAWSGDVVRSPRRALAGGTVPPVLGSCRDDTTEPGSKRTGTGRSGSGRSGDNQTALIAGPRPEVATGSRADRTHLSDVDHSVCVPVHVFASAAPQRSPTNTDVIAPPEMCAILPGMRYDVTEMRHDMIRPRHDPDRIMRAGDYYWPAVTESA